MEHKFLTSDNNSQRIAQDRRGQPTPMLSRYLFCGSRSQYRRVSEAKCGYYIDQPDKSLLQLIITTGILCFMDAVFSIYHIHQGALEVNPVAAVWFKLGYGYFLGFKLLPTAAGLFFLLLHQNFRFAWKGTVGIMVFYTVVVGYHLSLFFWY